MARLTSDQAQARAAAALKLLGTGMSQAEVAAVFCVSRAMIAKYVRQARQQPTTAPDAPPQADPTPREPDGRYSPQARPAADERPRGKLLGRGVFYA